MLVQGVSYQCLIHIKRIQRGMNEDSRNRKLRKPEIALLTVVINGGYSWLTAVIFQPPGISSNARLLIEMLK